MESDWLPKQLKLDGLSLEQTYERLHEVFEQILKNLGDVYVDEKTVRIDLSKDQFYPQYEKGFMHFVTRTNGKIRVFDPARAEKLNWVLPILKNYHAPEVSAFWSVGPKGDSLYLWLRDYDFLVILKNQKSAKYHDSRIMVTSYHVDATYRKTLQRRLDSAIKVL